MRRWTTALVWLRNDLRVHDNEALVRAVQEAEYVVPVYCLDPRQFATTSTKELGLPKTGPFRAQFLMESIADMRLQLQRLGGDLYIARGLPEVCVPAIVSEVGAQVVYFHKEVTDEELRVERALIAALEERGIQYECVWGSTLYHIDDLPFRVSQLPDVFTQFRTRVEKQSSVRPTFPVPNSVHLPSGISDVGKLPTVNEVGLESPRWDERTVLVFRGGETHGLQRLQEYFWERDCLRAYKETRNGLLGADYSSKLSAWLALGCLSPRFVYEEIQRYERERIANDSTYWLVFELLWRDFFRFVACKYGTALFRSTGIRGVRKSWSVDIEAFERWRQGVTGVKFVDANMRELLYTGFMSNRGRQNVASYLVNDLGIHWRFGAEWFESQLIDYDVCSNYGNWNYVAGIGNDPRENRYFNISKQATMYDPYGNYVRQWLQ
ncbi:MAG: DASH family cryptochrome [Bacteroidota bacterium]|nr:DASH family cryptochrome [Candidatus Kapabacteria bacterium]MDW8220352.1 DASH family cryptochrome [Bacteroidota bacterium]